MHSLEPVRLEFMNVAGTQQPASRLTRGAREAGQPEGAAGLATGQHLSLRSEGQAAKRVFSLSQAIGFEK